jgi:hypothetical protein
MRFLSLLALSCFVTGHLAAAPQWIWLSKDGNKDNKVTFRHKFEVTQNVQLATLELTCDNGATASLNGKQVLTNADWQLPAKADLSQVIKRGESNELIVNATNKGGSAAMLARLTLKLPAGRTDIVIETNGTWEAAKAGTQDFKKALVIDDYGKGPWGKPFDGKIGGGGGPAESVAADEVTVPKGFKVEKLYNVPKDQEGSWVALTVDPKGRLIACDQYGSIYRMSVPAIGKTENLKPEKLAIELGKAHGLLAAFDSLYVMVNEDGKNNGLYRLQDTNGDDQYDKTPSSTPWPAAASTACTAWSSAPMANASTSTAATTPNSPKVSPTAVRRKFGMKTTSSPASGMRTATPAASSPPAAMFAA